MSDNNKTQNIEISEKIKKWREQREKRLLDRIYRRNRVSSFPGIQPISAAVLGIKKCTSTDELQSNTADRRSLKPKDSRRSTFNINEQPKKKLDLFKTRFSQGNLNQRRSVMSHSISNRRFSTMKTNNKSVKKDFFENISKESKVCAKEVNVIKKDEIDFNKVVTVKNTEHQMGSIVEIAEKTEGKISESDCNDKHNSTFTLTNDDDENLPSPIENPNRKISDFKSKPKHKLQSILRPPGKSSQPDMRNKLQEWATAKGKSLNSIRHLNCFVSQVAPNTAWKPPLPIARKVQFSLSGGKTMFTPKRPNLQERRKTMTLSNAKSEKLIAITETIKEVEESSVELDSVADCGPIASTPEEELGQPILPHPENAQPPFTSEVLKSMTVSALNELLSVIQGNYCTEACEEWLLAIRQRNINADELPQYWECMAAIEEARGNMYLALDSYQRAVVQGAEVEHIESCLDRMYDKLKALNINAKEEKENVTSDQSNKAIYNSAKNKDVFKSTVIAFARIEKNTKQLNLQEGSDRKSIKYLVTPVRRSTRFNASRVSSPFVTLSNNVKELLPDDDDNQSTERKEIEFKTNKALLSYF